MLPCSSRFLGFRVPTVRLISSSAVLWKRDKKSGKRLKSKSNEKEKFPEKFERRMKSWATYLSKEIDACGTRSTGSNSEIGELSATHVHGCELQKCAFHAIDGKILEFSIGDTPLPMKMVRRGVPLTLRGNNQRRAVECIFWDHDGANSFRVKARDLKLDLNDMIGLKFTLELSDEFGALNSLADFLAIRDRWNRFRGYSLLQFAYRAVPMPMEVSDRKVNFVQKLNIEQEKAVCAALNKRRPLVSIQGPPGTGKTYVVTEIILQALRSGQKILVCAPSNQAVDNVLMRVRERVKACRLDSDSKVSLTEYMKTHENYEDLSSVYDQLNSAMQQCEEETVDALSRKAFDMRSEMKKSIFESKSVIFCTVSSSSVRGLKKMGFEPDIVLIDEAGQAMECAIWQPLLQGSRGVLVGDHRQLSAVITSDEAARGGLGQSLMDSMSAEFGQLTNFMLTIQYRMNEKICKWSNDEFYDSRIRSDPSAADITLADISRIPKDDALNSPLLMVDTELGEEGDYNERRYSSSYRNYGEAHIVGKYVQHLISCGVNPEQIGIISPYRAQVDLLKNIVANPSVTISSVDAFQGQQREVIVMSLVRNNEKRNLGFLCDDRRMNVAVMRARRQFVIVSNSRMMAEHKPMRNLHRTIQEHGRILEPSFFSNESRTKFVKRTAV
uniref:Thioredoxin domain-containing protein n=1 Tax=Steinernema glaseri TaxID=37863 RepID=A0A1I7YPL5_9BILA